MRIKKSKLKLSETSAIKGRSSEARDIELKRLDVIEDLEALMKKYARATGDDSLAKRKHKVGKGPQDFDAK